MDLGRGFLQRLHVRALVVLGATALSASLAPAAGAAMTSEKLGPKLCVTTGGARIVRAPGFPGERIDRRLLADLEFLRRRYKIFLTDGYSNDPVHSANGEHPMGLAMDIAPDKANGGRWGLIDKLAKFAEPKQNDPRAPFRWVGYNGDSGHGRGHHLHLSYNHSKPRQTKPPRTVYTLKCPKSSKKPGKPNPPDDGSNTGGVSFRSATPEPETAGISLP